MNADDFYESYKTALTFLGVSWGDKEHVRVALVDNRLELEFDGSIAGIALPVEATKDRLLLAEAHAYGQFADDFDRPLAKPLRAAIRRLVDTYPEFISSAANKDVTAYNQAIDDAIAVLDSVSVEANPMTARDCADQLRSMRKSIIKPRDEDGCW